MIFPTYLLLLIPMVWVYILPGNFIIDSIVLLITLKLLKVNHLFENYGRVIFKVWFVGLLADFVGAFVLFAFSQGLYALGEAFPDSSKMNDILLKISQGIDYYPFCNIVVFFVYILAIGLSGFFIYHFNKKIYCKLDLSEKKSKILALTMAIVTAPYLMLLPYDMFSK